MTEEKQINTDTETLANAGNNKVSAMTVHLLFSPPPPRCCSCCRFSWCCFWCILSSSPSSFDVKDPILSSYARPLLLQDVVGVPQGKSKNQVIVAGKTCVCACVCVCVRWFVLSVSVFIVLFLCLASLRRCNDGCRCQCRCQCRCSMSMDHSFIRYYWEFIRNWNFWEFAKLRSGKNNGKHNSHPHSLLI